MSKVFDDDVVQDVDRFVSQTGDALPAELGKEMESPEAEPIVASQQLLENSTLPRDDLSFFSGKGLESRLEAATAGAVQSALFNWGDEAYAKLLTTLQGRPEDYRKEQLRALAYLKNQETKHPWAYQVGEVAGMLPTGKATLSGAKAAGGLLRGMVKGAASTAKLGTLVSAGKSEANLDTEQGAKQVASDVLKDIVPNLALGTITGGLSEKLNFKTSKDPYYRTLNKARELGLEGINPAIDEGKDILAKRLESTIQKSANTLVEPIKESQDLFRDAINGFTGKIKAAKGFNTRIESLLDQLEGAHLFGGRKNLANEIRSVIGNPNATMAEVSTLERLLHNKAYELGKDPVLMNYQPILKNMSEVLKDDVVHHNLGDALVKQLKQNYVEDKGVVGRFLNDIFDPTKQTAGQNKLLKALGPQRMEELLVKLEKEFEPIVQRLSYGTGISEPERARLNRLAEWIKKQQGPKQTSKIDVDKLVSDIEDTSLEQSVLRNIIGDRRLGRTGAMQEADKAIHVGKDIITGNPQTAIMDTLRAPFSTQAQNLYGRVMRQVQTIPGADLEKGGLSSKLMPYNWSQNAIRWYANTLINSADPKKIKAGKQLLDGMSRSSGNTAAALFSVGQTSPELRQGISDFLSDDESEKVDVNELLEENK